MVATPGTIIFTLRNKCNISLEELSTLLGCTTLEIQNIEKAKIEINLQMWLEFCSFFNLPASLIYNENWDQYIQNLSCHEIIS